MENSNQQENVSMTVENADVAPQTQEQKTQQVTQEVTQQAQQGQQPKQEMVTVPIALLQNVVNILDIISARGVFKPAEYAGVGSVYNNLSLFVNKQA
jgi:hypothetical protein